MAMLRTARHIPLSYQIQSLSLLAAKVFGWPGGRCASNWTEIDHFGAPVSTTMGRVSVPSLTEIGRLGAPKMAKMDENWPSQGPKWLTRRPEINQNWPTDRLQATANA